MKKIKELLLITPEMVLNKIYNEVFKGNIKDFLFLMMAEVLIYLPMMTHWLTNGDGTAISFTVKQGHQWEISLGRFGIMFTDKLRDNIVYPSGITTISLTLLAITIVLVFRIFDIDKNLIKFLTGALLVLSPVVSNTLTYYYCSDSYFLAYLLSVLTVYLFVKYFSILTWCGAVFCILVSLSLYQAYIGTTMTLCLIFLVHQILNSNKDSKKYLLRMVTGGAAGVVSYLLLFKILQKVMDFKATSNRGFDKNRRKSTLY